MNKIPQILLAAGKSSRMGFAKQLLKWGEKTLIEHQIETLITTQQEVVVVLGAYAEQISTLIKESPIHIVISSDWHLGLAHSLIAGIKEALEKTPNAQGFLISLNDMPFITSTHLENLIKTFKNGQRQILVSKSQGGWTGPPIIFDRCYYDELCTLKGDEGAKKILSRYLEKITFMETDILLEDIDTLEDYEKLIKISN